MKKLFPFFILALSLCLCSCDKDDVAINEYYADIFESLYGETNEYYFIESTYQDAFSYAGLVDGHGINSMKSASRDKVLQACAASEETIKDANYEFLRVIMLLKSKKMVSAFISRRSKLNTNQMDEIKHFHLAILLLRILFS
jgi:hypothetical protein